MDNSVVSNILSNYADVVDSEGRFYRSSHGFNSDDISKLLEFEIIGKDVLSKINQLIASVPSFRWNNSISDTKNLLVFLEGKIAIDIHTQGVEPLYDVTEFCKNYSNYVVPEEFIVSGNLTTVTLDFSLFSQMIKDNKNPWIITSYLIEKEMFKC